MDCTKCGMNESCEGFDFCPYARAATAEAKVERLRKAICIYMRLHKNGAEFDEGETDVDWFCVSMDVMDKLSAAGRGEG